MALALLVVAAPVAFAGRPDDAGDAGAATKAERQVENVEREQARSEEKAEAQPGRAERSAPAGRTSSPRRRATPGPSPACSSRGTTARLYTLAPGGDFETLAEGWTLEGATVAADSSPFVLGAALGVSSLELPAGATALSPPICVERGFPSFRLTARTVSTDQAVVKVGVVYADGRVKDGRLKPAADGRSRASSRWRRAGSASVAASRRWYSCASR